MRNNLILLGFFISFGTVSGITQQNRPPEIPSHDEAASGKEWLSAKTVTVTVTSRRSENPDSPQDLQRVKKKDSCHSFRNSACSVHWRIARPRTRARCRTKCSLRDVSLPERAVHLFASETPPIVTSFTAHISGLAIF